jgi:N-acyl-D-amino-acid deacylase
MDPETASDMGGQLEPRRYPTGIEHVFVNGVQVVKKGQHTGVMPGKILYRE